MDVASTEGSPVIIGSFSCDGEDDGGLVIETGKHLRVNGHLTNSATAASDRYHLTMEPNTTLKLVDASGNADLRRINVTMEAVTSGDPSKLVIDGEFDEGEFVAYEQCELTSGTNNNAEPSFLAEILSLHDGAHATFEAGLQLDYGTIATLDGGSKLTVLLGAYGADSIFMGCCSDLDAQLLYGDGNNVIEMGSFNATSPSFEFDCPAIARPLSSSSSPSLELSLIANLIVHTDFEGNTVRSSWDSRNIDIAVQPFPSELTHSRYEVHSPELKDYFPGDPVVFLDVPCLGAWRDFVVEDAGEVEADITNVNDEYSRAYIDDLFGGCTFSFNAEVGIFRDVVIGKDRALSFPSFIEGYGQPRIY